MPWLIFPSRLSLSLKRDAGLLCHTSGLTYEITGNAPVQRTYAQLKLGSRELVEMPLPVILAKAGIHLPVSAPLSHHARKCHHVLNFCAYAYPLVQRVVVVRGHVRHDGFAALQAQGV
jgi:hypothetical protein